MKRLLLLTMLLLPLAAAAQSPCTVKDEMDLIGETFSVYFVYDSGLPVNGPTTFSVDPEKSLQKNLRGLFDNTEIIWWVKSPYVVLARRDTVLGPAPVWPEPEWNMEPVTVMDTLTEAVKTARTMMMLPTGGFQFNPVQTRRVVTPIGEGDVFKYAQTLPGISSGGEGVTSVHVRGGNMGSNAVTIDGVQLYGISHLMGLTSVLPGDVIGVSELKAGGFRSDVGNFTSSHIDLQSYTGDFERSRARFTVNPFMTSASISTPLQKGRSSFLGSVRFSPIELGYKAFKNKVNSIQNSFDDMGATVGDIYGKFTVRCDNRKEVAFSLFGSLDNYRFGIPGESGTTGKKGWSNVIANLSWDTHQTAGFDHIHTSLSLNDHRWNQETITNQKNSLFFSRKQLLSSLDELMLQSTGSRSWDRWSLRAGVQVRGARFNPGSNRVYLVRMDSPGGRILYQDEEGRFETLTRSILSTVHGEVEYNVPEALLLRLSVRGNVYFAKQDPDISYTHIHPEAGLLAQVHMTPWVGIEGTVDYRTQYYHALEAEMAGWSYDPIIAASADNPPERAFQGYLGLFGGFGMHSFRAGGFYKQMWDIIYYRKDTDLLNYGRNRLKAVGDGNAYGAEFFYMKEGRDLSWQLSYTLSKSDRRFTGIALGDSFPARYDRRHILHASARWKGLTAAFTCQSGHNETVSVYDYIGWNLGNGDIFNEPDPFNWSVPAFIRFDIGYRFSFRSGKDRHHPLNHSLTVGVYNLFNRHNASQLSFDAEEMKWKLISYFPIMPSITYQLEL